MAAEPGSPRGSVCLCGPPVCRDVTGRHRQAGKATAELAMTHAESEFEKYRIVQDRLFESDFDRMIKKLLGKGDTP
jgi:hypothetical protein